MSIAALDERTPLVIGVQFLAADGVGWKTIYTGPVSGARVDDILLSSNGAVAHVVEFRITLGGVNYIIGSISIPSGAGFAGAAAVSAAALPIPPLQSGWLLGYQTTLACHVAVVMGAAEELNVVAFGGIL